MNWDSLAGFLAMGGYARYVWGSVAVCMLGIGFEILSLRIRRRAALRKLQLHLVAKSETVEAFQ
ncbi:MAG: heme exporter protein CcmD [Thiomonas sp.]